MKKYILLSMCLIMGFMACDDGEVDPVDQSSIFIEDVARFEGNSGTAVFTFRVKMDKATTEDVTFNYETRDGSATAGTDYEAASGTKTIAVGATEVSIEVTIIGDEEYENIVQGATIKMGARFDRLGHAMQVYYTRDPGRIGSQLEKLAKPLRQTANNIGIEIDEQTQKEWNEFVDALMPSLKDKHLSKEEFM
mgnify:CR=1 FL=1